MDGNRFSPQMDSNMHHRGVWTESLDGCTMGRTRIGRRKASSWTWRQFWGITNLSISNGTSLWCFRGIEDRERETIFFGKGRPTTISVWIDISISLIHSESISSTMSLLLLTHCSEIFGNSFWSEFTPHRDCRFTLSMGSVPSTPCGSNARPVDTVEYLIGTFVVYKWGPT